jgi:hypothetical protein
MDRVSVARLARHLETTRAIPDLAARARFRESAAIVSARASFSDDEALFQDEHSCRQIVKLVSGTFLFQEYFIAISNSYMEIGLA